MRDYILLNINGRERRVRGRDVFTTLANYLRYDLCQTGTKIVCDEGDCGACSVLVRRGDGDFVPINSCIRNVGQLDGMSVVTVEGLKVDGHLNGVQEAMVAHHGAQCGYCTPGFVVAMSALFENADRVDEQCVRDGLTGNLCRCTGYEPIIKAALAVDAKGEPRVREQYPQSPKVEDGARVEADGRIFFAPATLDDAIQFKAQGATIVQGGTDVGVWVNKRSFAAPRLLSLAHVPGLGDLREENGEIVAGANVTLAQFERFVRDRIPELFRILNIFGSPQIRNSGTLIGNIANGSPIGDTLPYLFVSGARLELTGANGTREVAVGSFYKGYKTFDLAQDELITRVFIPIVGDTLRLYKVSRRRDLDISAFTAAVRLRVDGGRIADPRIAYGGVGPVVLRLPRTEEFLAGKEPSLPLFEEAGRIARGEVAPISDVRGSRDYRLQLAENILAKFWFEAFSGAAAGTPAPDSRAPGRALHTPR